MCAIVNSGIRIFDYLRIIFEGTHDRKDICRRLKKCGIIVDFETVRKYHRTLIALGYDIYFFQRRSYHILNTPFEVKIDDKYKDDMELIYKMLDCILGEKKRAQKNIFQAKFAYITGEKSKMKEPEKGNVTTLERVCYAYCGEPLSAKYYRNKELHNVVIRDIRYAKNGVFLICTEENTDKLHTVNVNLAARIRCEKVSDFGRETVFKLKGKLKNNYILRCGEKARYFEDEVYVVNNREDKQALFNRLIKYGPQCEVVLPKTDKRLFKKKVRSLIRYYKSK